MSMTDEQKKLLTLATVGLAFSLALSLVLNRNPLALVRSDLYVRWYAIDRLLAEGRNLYDSRSGEEVNDDAWRGLGYPRTVSFYYPAHLIALIGPLNLLPYPVAHLVWTFAGQIFYLVGVWLITRLAGWPDSLNKRTILIIAAVLFVPYLQHTIWSQFNTIGVLSLVLCLWALHRQRPGLAGILAVGLTFKPHATVLTLAFLLLWAVFKRERWRFLMSFGLTALIMWVIAEAFQPRWVIEFLSSIGSYGVATSGLDLIWNPHQIPAALLCLAVLIILALNGRTPASNPAFGGCIALSLTAWSLVVPAVGMMHVVLLPVAVVLLFSGLKTVCPRLYRPALCGVVLLYVLGIAGFAWGLSSPELYGKHIDWSEYVYKVAAPICIGLFSLPLCLNRKRKGMPSI